MPKDDSYTSPLHIIHRGRGTNINPTGRFENRIRVQDGDDLDYLVEEDGLHEGKQRPTRLHVDTSKTIISTNDSPDIGMEATLNPYRGCEHGCIYCYARPTHEYLGYSPGVDFESEIFVKESARDLLVQKLSSKSWQPRVIALSGITDPYQPTERHKKITRGCLEVLQEFKNPAAIITKNFLVTRDLDLFQSMAAWNGIKVNLSLTTLDPALSRAMEPRASQPALRLKAIETLAKNGIPVGIIIGPVLPGLTDHEIPAILKSASDAGALGASYTLLRLPYGVKDLFRTWLEDNYPDKAQRIIAHVRDTRGGQLYDSRFGTRMRGEGQYADNIAALFTLYKNKYGLNKPHTPLSTAHFKKTARAEQRDLFD